MLINQLVVEAFAIGRLHNVALGVDTVLVTFLGGLLMLVLEFGFLLYCVQMVLDQSFGRRDIKLVDASIVEFIDRLIEGFGVNLLTLRLKLFVQIGKLILDSLSLEFKVLVVEPVFRLAIDP